MKKTLGFTLVEIMIVVAIIGLLAAIAIPSFMRARTNSQKSACINNLRQIESGKDQAAMDIGYTNGWAAWDGTAGYSGTTDDVIAFSNMVEGATGYVKQYPLCPASTTEQQNAVQAAWDYNVNAIGSNSVCTILGGSAADSHALSK